MYTGDTEISEEKYHGNWEKNDTYIYIRYLLTINVTGGGKVAC